MKYSKEKIADNKIKLTIEADKKEIEKAREEAIEKFAAHVKVSGFRPGKAPKNLVEKEIGQERIDAEMLDSLIPLTYYDAIIKENLQVVGAPEVKVLKFVPTDELTYEAIVELMPEIKLPDLSKIKVKRQEVKVTDKDIQEVLDDLAKQLQKSEPVERPARKGDRVEINFEGFIGNVPFEGGKSENYPLVLGSGQFIPGFEEQLEGMKVNEEKEVKVNFPKDYHAENLAGKEATFKVKVNGIEELVMPEITDEFAKLVGPFENLKTLKEDIEKQLKFTKEQEARRKVEDEILDEMAKKVKFEAPSSLVSQEMERLIHEAEHNLSHQGLTLEKYFELTKTSREELENQMKPEAEKRVKVGLLLTEVSKEQNFKVTEKDIAEAVKKRTEYLPEDQKKQAESYYDSHEGKHQLENMLIGQKVIDYLYETCSK